MAHWVCACRILAAGWTGLLLTASLPAAEIFHVTTYNLDNYLEQSTERRRAKSEPARAKIRESLRAAHAEVLALEEVGGQAALHELQAALKAEGLNYPYVESVSASDTNIQVVILSQFPMISRQPHTNESFLLYGRRFRVSRGFAEVTIQVNPGYRFTLLAAHLKSRRASLEADEADLREQEALVLRGLIEARLEANPELNLLVLGDFNDTKESRTVRTLLGRGRLGLVDARPAERNGDDAVSLKRGSPPPAVTWTYYYDKTDTYSRIDYILMSRGMAREWQEKETYIAVIPNWGLASDHRPIVAGFLPMDSK